MSGNISPTELTLLEYLHKHSGVSGGRIGLDPKPIKRELRISMTRFAEDSVALAAYGFAELRYARAGAGNERSSTCSAIWVTTKGVEYLSRSRSQPGTAMTRQR